MIVGILSVPVAPQLQKHDGQVPGAISPEHHRRIFPMAVFFIGIDIFVRQVQSPAEAHIPVNTVIFR